MTGVYLTSTVIEAFISAAWIDISDRVVTDLNAQMGMFDASHSNRLASPGSLSFSMNNNDGAYTPSPTFRRGIPIKVTCTYGEHSREKFYGRVSEIDVDAGEVGEERVHVRVLDWLDFATNQTVREQPVQTDKKIEEAVAQLLMDFPVQPNAVLLESGVSTFPTIFDAVSKNTTMYRELNDLILSEYGYGYMDRGGERLHIEAGDSRKNTGELAQLPVDSDGSVLLKEDGDILLLEDGTGGILLETTTDAVYNNNFSLDSDNPKIVHGKHVLNDVSFTVYPKRTDTVLKVLFTLSYPIFVPELSLIEVIGYFSDPTGGNKVSGISFTDPVATTDFLMNSEEDGSGTNLTANFSVVPIYSSEGVKYQITNSNVGGYITFLQQRGFGIYTYNPIEIIADDAFSKKEYGVRSLSIRQPYQQNTDVALFESARIIDIDKDPRNVLQKVQFTANASDELMKSFLLLDIGNLVKITNVKPAIDSFFYIQGMTWKIGFDGSVEFSWICKELVQLRAIAVKYSGTYVSRNAVIYGLQSRISSCSQISLSAWVYLTGNTNCPVISNYGGGVGWYLFVLATGKIQFRQNFTPTDGIWSTTNDVLTACLNGWHQIGVSYDNSSDVNNAVFYVDGVSVAVTETDAPSGTADLGINQQFMLGNMKIVTDVLGYNFLGLQRDVRVYNRILTADEWAALAAGENDYTTVPDGLIFNGFFVRDFRWEDYVGDSILPNMKVLDRLYESTGSVTYDTSIANSQVKGEDPDLVSY